MGTVVSIVRKISGSAHHSGRRQDWRQSSHPKHAGGNTLLHWYISRLHCRVDYSGLASTKAVNIYAEQQQCEEYCTPTVAVPDAHARDASLVGTLLSQEESGKFQQQQTKTRPIIIA
jgi:hypothetical protein